MTAAERTETRNEAEIQELAQISNAKLIKKTENVKRTLPREMKNQKLRPVKEVMKIVLHEELITTEGRNHRKESQQGRALDHPAQGEGEERMLKFTVIPKTGGTIRCTMKKVEDIVIDDIGQELHHHRQGSIAHAPLL